MVFAPGRRPRAEDVVALAKSTGLFAISHQPPADEGWLELLINGLTFDLLGLAPAGPVPLPEVAHRYGLPGDAGEAGEGVALAPGPHLAAGRSLPPVIRGAVAIARDLAGMAGVAYVAWQPARCAIAAEPFARSVAAWLGGGAFPALGLTAIDNRPDGRMCSEGLALFIGQEVCLERNGAATNDAGKLTLRLIDRLVAHGRLTEPLSWRLDDGREVRLEPEGSTIRAWVRNG